MKNLFIAVLFLLPFSCVGQNTQDSVYYFYSYGMNERTGDAATIFDKPFNLVVDNLSDTLVCKWNDKIFVGKFKRFDHSIIYNDPRYTFFTPFFRRYYYISQNQYRK